MDKYLTIILYSNKVMQACPPLADREESVKKAYNGLEVCQMLMTGTRRAISVKIFVRY